MFVVDASVTMAWCFEDEVTPFSDGVLERLGREEALVPALWRLEVGNVLLVAERKGRLTQAQSTRFIQLLTALPIRLGAENEELSALMALGRDHHLTAYDASYLALALREGLPLATTDVRLRAASSRAGVPLLS